MPSQEAERQQELERKKEEKEARERELKEFEVCCDPPLSVEWYSDPL